MATSKRTSSPAYDSKHLLFLTISWCLLCSRPSARLYASYRRRFFRIRQWGFHRRDSSCNIGINVKTPIYIFIICNLVAQYRVLVIVHINQNLYTYIYIHTLAQVIPSGDETWPYLGTSINVRYDFPSDRAIDFPLES